MLADEEWKTPHWSPGGKSVAEWVEGVRWFERNGWLRDPATITPHPSVNPDVHRRDENTRRLCHGLCWRPRCRRARRCRFLMPLALREWQPEYAMVLKELWNMPDDYAGPYDKVKLAELRRLHGMRVP